MPSPYASIRPSPRRAARWGWLALIVLGGSCGLVGLWLTQAVGRLAPPGSVPPGVAQTLVQPATGAAAPVVGAPLPGVLADRYLAAWMAHDYGAMHALLAPSARARIDAGDFRGRYEAIAEEAMVLAMTVERDGATPVEATSQPFSLRLTTARTGIIAEHNALPFVFEAGAWGIDWRPALIFRDLRAGDRVRLEADSPVRGRILDRHGRILARQTPVATIGVVPAELLDVDAMVRQLAAALGVDAAALRDRIDASQPDWFVPVARRAWHAPTPAERQLLDLPGVVGRIGDERTYPMASLAAHVVGAVRLVTEAEAATARQHGLRPHDWTGAFGVEASQEAVLAGRPGGRLAIVVPDGAIRAILGQSAAVPGRDVYLTIEATVQQAAEAALDDRTGAVVVLEAATGAVRAMASRPTFDPNRLVRDPGALDQLSSELEGARANRAVTLLRAPGQPFALVTAATAVAALGVSSEAAVACPAAVPAPGQAEVWRNARSLPAEPLPVAQALAEGCATAFHALAVQLHERDPRLLPAMARRLGFGAPVAVAGGTDAPAAWSLLDGDAWSLPDAIGAAAGQRHVLTTPLQLARAYAAAANGGTLWTPRVIERIGATERVQEPPPTVVFAGDEPAGQRLQAIVLSPPGRMGLASSGTTGQDQGETGLQIAGIDRTTTPGAASSWQVAVLAAPSPTVVVVGLDNSESAAPVARRVIASGVRFSPPPN